MANPIKCHENKRTNPLKKNVKNSQNIKNKNRNINSNEIKTKRSNEIWIMQHMHVYIHNMQHMKLSKLM